MQAIYGSLPKYHSVRNRPSTTKQSWSVTIQTKPFIKFQLMSFMI
jgi:hypothetical protein